MVYSVEEIKNIIMPIVKRYNIPAIFLFGSYARGEANENSDIDFLVDTTGTGLNSLLTLGALYCDLEEAFEKHIDLITVRSIMQEPKMPSDVDFKNTVMRERVQLNEVA